jgi:tetratricopeptide (TPR) repeat protein
MLPDHLTSQLAAALQRPRDDPLIIRLLVLLNDLAIGRLTETEAQAALDYEPTLKPIRTIVSFEGAMISGDVTIGDVAAGDVIKISLVLPPELPPVAPPFSVPYPRPAEPLVGRQALFDDLRTHLCVTAPVRLALDGMPGAGKTRLALELVYDDQVRRHFSGGILMTGLGQQPHIESLLRRWCDDLGLQHASRRSSAEQFAHIARRLNQGGHPCLVIVDDIWATDDASAFLFASPVASFLFTSRQRDQLQQPIDYETLIGPSNLISIPPLDVQRAVDLLRQNAGLPAPAYQAELEALAHLVGGLPLLLAAMGAYLRREGQPQTSWFAQALDDLQQASRRLNLPTGKIEQTRQNLHGGLFARFRHKPVLKPLSANAIIELSVSALPYAMGRAFIRLAAIPPAPHSFGLDSASEVIENDDERVLRLLVQRNLLISVGDDRYSLHRVLWDWAEQRGYREVQDARRRLSAWHVDLTKAEYANEFDDWRRHPDNWEQMLRTWYEAVDDPERLAVCINTILPLLIEQGYWSAVLTGLERALEIFRREDKQLSAWIRYYMGSIHMHQADYDKAREETEAALDGFQLSYQLLSQASALHQLAEIEISVANYSAAKKLSEEALKAHREVGQPDCVGCLGCLGSVYFHEGNVAVARTIFERVVAICEQRFGSDHITTARQIGWLARVLLEQGEYVAARQLYERVLQIEEQVLGPNHYQTASTLNNLAEVLELQGEHSGVHPLLERAFQIKEQVLGSDHPETAISLNNLACDLKMDGDYAGARTLFERVLAICEQSLGSNHPNTATAIYNLAQVLEAQGDYITARPLIDRALQIRELMFGSQDPKTQQIRHYLAKFNQHFSESAG